MSVGEVLQSAWARITQVTHRVTQGIYRHPTPGNTLAARVRSNMAAVIICYTCRRRITRQEIAQGLHNHDQAEQRERESKSPKRASSDIVRSE